MGPESVPGALKVTVRHVERQARRLVTVRPHAPAWTVGDQELDRVALGGAIVRIQPPWDATDAAIAELREHCGRCGALAVRVAPRAAAPAVVRAKGKREAARQAAAPRVSVTFREVVMGMVDEAHTEDRDALRELVDEVITAEGL